MCQGSGFCRGRIPAIGKLFADTEWESYAKPTAPGAVDLPWDAILCYDLEKCGGVVKSYTPLDVLQSLL
jgi:hypothetical protein